MTRSVVVEVSEAQEGDMTGREKEGTVAIWFMQSDGKAGREDAR